MIIRAPISPCQITQLSERKLGADQRGWIDMISQELAKLPR